MPSIHSPRHQWLHIQTRKTTMPHLLQPPTPNLAPHNRQKRRINIILRAMTSRRNRHRARTRHGHLTLKLLKPHPDGNGREQDADGDGEDDRWTGVADLSDAVEVAFLAVDVLVDEGEEDALGDDPVEGGGDDEERGAVAERELEVVGCSLAAVRGCDAEAFSSEGV